MHKKRGHIIEDYTVISDSGMDRISQIRQRIFIYACMVVSIGLIIIGILAIINP